MGSLKSRILGASNRLYIPVYVFMLTFVFCSLPSHRCRELRSSRYRIRVRPNTALCCGNILSRRSWRHSRNQYRVPTTRCSCLPSFHGVFMGDFPRRDRHGGLSFRVHTHRCADYRIESPLLYYLYRCGDRSVCFYNALCLLERLKNVCFRCGKARNTR